MAAPRSGAPALNEHRPMIVAESRIADDLEYRARLARVFELEPRARGETTLGELILRDALSAGHLLPDGPRRQPGGV